MKMRKATLGFLLFLSTLSVPAQDTTFILKNRTKYFYHAIFFEPNKDSKYYRYVADFNFKEFDKRDYVESVKKLKKNNPAPFPRYNFGSLPKQWCLLFSYKGQFCIYSPSDYISNYKVAISDSTFIDYYGDGIMASRIQSFDKKNTKTYQFKLINSQSQERALVIHWVDPKNGIAIFEKPNEEPMLRYRLMVQADKVKNFPLIVNYCDKEKQEEFEGFDKIDFKKWLDKK